MTVSEALYLVGLELKTQDIDFCSKNTLKSVFFLCKYTKSACN